MSAGLMQANAYSPPVLLRAPERENPFIDVSDSVRLLARLVIAVTLVAGWLLGLFSDNAAPYQLQRLLIFTVSLAISTLPLWYKLPGVGILHPLFLIASYDFMKGTLPSLNPSVLGLGFHPFLNAGPKEIALLQFQVTGVYMLAQIMTYLGYFVTRGISWNFVRFRGKESVLIFAGFATFVVGIVGFYLLTDLSGGLYWHLKNITRGSTAKFWVKDPAFASVYATMAGLLVIAPAFWMLIGKRPGYQPGFWVLTAIAVSTSYLVGGRRAGIVGVVVILVACWILRTRRISIGRVAIIWLLLFLSIGILGEYRRSNWTRGTRVNTEAFKNKTFSEAFQMSWEEMQGRREASPIYLILARVPEEVPYLYGSNYLGYVNRFIPRYFWPDKPRGLATECAGVFYGSYSSGAIPMGDVGEAYWSGGLVAVTIVFFLWGIVLRSIGTFFVKFRHSAFASLLYLVTVIRLSPDELAVGQWLYLVVPACAFLFLAGEIRPAGRSR